MNLIELDKLIAALIAEDTAYDNTDLIEFYQRKRVLLVAEINKDLVLKGVGAVVK